MRILFLTQWFQPEPVFKGLPFAKALRDRGHEVQVLTGFPNYPGGKLYPSYQLRLWQREIIDGIQVNRVVLYPSHDRSGFRRILNYTSFGLSSAILGPLLAKKPDVIYVCNLVTLGLTSWVLQHLHDCPVVYDILDLWPDSVADSRMMDNSFLLNILKRWCYLIYNHASHLVVTTPGMKLELAHRGIPENRISVIYNWCEEDHIRPVKRDKALATKLGLANSFIVMFAGTMGIMQGLDAVLDSAQMLMKIEPKVKFVFVGGGIEKKKLEQSVAHRNLTNVTFIERQPPEKMNTILKAADVLLVHLKDTALFRITIPSKIQAYLFSGKPILMGVQGDSANIIRDSGAGKVVEPENPESITRGILELFRMSDAERATMGKNGRKYYDKELSMQAGVSCFENIFHRLLGK